MAKTIKQLANELGVSKQAIQYHYNKLPAKDQKKDSRGYNIVNPSAEKQIRIRVTNYQQTIDKSNIIFTTKGTPNKNQTDTKESTQTDKEESDVVALLKAQLSDLKEQRDKELTTKDQQIEHLGKLLDQSQQLQLIAEQKIRQLETSQGNSGPTDKQPKHIHV